MRTAAIVYVLLSLTANFIVDHFIVLLLAMISFPLTIWLLLKKKKKPLTDSKVSRHATEQGTAVNKTFI